MKTIKLLIPACILAFTFTAVGCGNCDEEIIEPTEETNERKRDSLRIQ